MSENIYAGTTKYTLIYIFDIPDEAHKGYLKVGETHFTSSSSYKTLTPNCEELNKYARIRIKQITQTALTKYNLLHTELARRLVRLSDGTEEITSFSDNNVHEVLDRSGFDVHKFYDSGRDSEWYAVDLQTAIAAISAVKEGRKELTAAEKTGQIHTLVAEKTGEYPKSTAVDFNLRDEQSLCVKKTMRVFSRNDRMLWDCKMRFGKTRTAYALIKDMNFQKVIVVTHRPVVVDSWSSEFDLLFKDKRTFVTKSNIKAGDRFTAEDASIDAENDRNLRNLAQRGEPFVYFASMQDLRGSTLAGGKFNKNKAVFEMDWDLIIYDEAHEGTQTELGQSVQTLLEKPKEGKNPKKVLQLSGTPYNLLNQYSGDNVFQWDYVMEQEAKQRWEEKHPGDHNPYADLPEMRICTFDLRNKLVGSYRYEDENVAFNFKEFFRTWTGDYKKDFCKMPPGAKVGDFVHANDIQAFLDLISKDSDDSNYPFATQDYRDMFRHTFWILPGVKEARALSSMLKKHPIFQDYEVVNVAGEGDVEKPYDDALEEVRDAIKKHERTITLSCGKLTTGVTVKEWTGVMLLSGSSSTGAAGYMQTIFRVQSPGSIDGKQKSVCYAFDFAPDRTLNVIAKIHQLKKNAVGTDDDGRITLGKFLNFCPILAEGETGMEPYDVPKMMRQIKKISVESAIKSGFDDDSIYKSDAGIVMDREQQYTFNILARRLTPQSKAKKQTDIEIARTGMSSEEYEKSQVAKHKPKKDRTPEELAALEREKELKKNQQALFDLLRNVSIRLPLLIFGTAAEFDESIRLAEFVDKVDNASWTEFMPNGLDKDLFLKLLCFYDEDVIEGAGMRIRSMAKAADELMPTQRVLKIAELFSYFKNPAKETVLTPWRVVNMHMGDTIGGYNFYKEGYPMKDGLLEDGPRLIEQKDVTDNLFLNENVRILEMNSKSGLYPLYVAYSIYRMMLPKDEEQMTLEEAQTWWQKVLSKHLFVLCQTTMAVSITKRTLAGYTEAKVNATYLTRLLDRMKDEQRLANKIKNPETWGMGGEKLKFDAVVGNPPYQLNDGAGGGSASPIYQYFVKNAIKLNPNYVSMIMPSRWMTGGKGLDDFRREMINDHSIKVLHDFFYASECFTGVDIKGGVCYFLRDSHYHGKCTIFTHCEDGVLKTERYMVEKGDDIFIRDGRLINIKSKVASKEKSFSSLVSSRKPFGLPNDFFKNPLKYNLPQISDEPIEGGYSILGLVMKDRVYKYIPSDYPLPKKRGLDKYKVFISESYGDGQVGDTPPNPVLAHPGECCTETFLQVGPFETELEARNCISYIQTKLFRILVSMRKKTQHATQSIYSYVPLLDFSKSWTDEELYARYGLTDEEIAFIERTVKPIK